MQDVQLFIQDQRVELFNDETISLTSTIQNVRDIAKVFTDFSHQFTLPASRPNNKIFKHYYNSDITRGFDARKKVAASIKLNGAEFRKGYIQLNSVDLKDNVANSYKVVFFGETVSLPKLLGNTELADLTWLDRFNHEYKLETVLWGLREGLHYNGTAIVEGSVRDIIYPLISHTNRFFYNSSGATVTNETNLYNGVAFTQLKPAIKLRHIITAIEQKIGYTFSVDFFNSANFTELYLYLHREKGGVYAGVTEISKILNYVFFTEYTDDLNYTEVEAIFNVAVGTSAGKYNVLIKNTKTNVTLHTAINKEGNSSYASLFKDLQSSSQDYPIDVTISTANATAFPSFTLDRSVKTTTVVNGVGTNVTTTGTSGLQSMTGLIQVREQMPKMKVVDFLIGLFKMFNLTAYVEGAIIHVKTLDSYYLSGVETDITKYIDVTSHSVDKALEHSEINFKFQEAKTILTITRKERFNEVFGSLDWVGNDVLDGGKYEISLPFEKVMFERLNNGFNSIQTAIQYGWLVDLKKDPILTAPLIFYNIHTSLPLNVNNELRLTGHGVLTSYNRPSNVISNGLQTLNFNSEVEEWALSVNSSSLFENFYKKYIVNLFNQKARILKLKAYLPLRILLKYKLADTWVIAGKKYNINSVQTNLQTNESNLELISK